MKTTIKTNKETAPRTSGRPALRTGRSSVSSLARRHFGVVSLALLTTLAVVACARDTDSSAPVARQTMAESPFVDATAAAGLDFVHFNGMSGEFYFNEMMGAGAALFDYDNDGDLDLYLVQGGTLGDKSPGEALLSPPDPVMEDRLYRNDLGTDGVVRFTDVTEQSGLHVTSYGMGVATGDYDNDGWIDLYVTNYGANNLLRNNGDGTFTDVTRASGTGEDRWSVPALFFDFDRDGWLDLFTGNYVDFRVETHKRCTSELGLPNYCGPQSYRPQSDRLWRNLGDGTFEDVTGPTGIATDFGGALGAVVADVDLDGWLDLYVANDGVPNQLWMNRSGEGFDNRAILAGAAVNEQGNAEASMGVVAADYDNDRDEDLFMAHLTDETNTLFVNDGSGMFEDRSTSAGLAAGSLRFTAFAGAWLDYDNDGQLDLMVVNGAVKTIAALVLAGDPFPLHQSNQLYRLDGGVYRELRLGAGSPFAVSEVSRGLALGDVDNDGDTDVVVTNNGGPVRLLMNEFEGDEEWLGLRLVDVVGSGQRDMLGAWVGVVTGDGDARWRRVATDGAYASAKDPRLLFGLGRSALVERVEVHWPDGLHEAFAGLEVGHYHVLRRGSGRSLMEGGA